MFCTFLLPFITSMFPYLCLIFRVPLSSICFLFCLMLMHYHINSFPSLAPLFSPRDLFRLSVFLLAVLAVWHTIIFFLLTVLLRSSSLDNHMYGCGFSLDVSHISSLLQQSEAILHVPGCFCLGRTEGQTSLDFVGSSNCRHCACVFCSWKPS